LRARKENVIAMFSLEMLGYYSAEPHSQNYPGFLHWIYPDTASFIAFVSNIPSSLLLYRSLRSFRRHTGFHAEGLFMSERLLPDIRRSDHASFWDGGFKALMVTDTSFYRNPNYHTVGDVARTLDYTRMAAVVTGLRGMLADFAQN
ncbi:MAG: M28 family peptidase, partial [Gammaproteobacteria bacterium]